MLSPTTRIIHPRPGSLSHPYTPVALNSPALDRATLSRRKIYYVRTDNITFSLSPTLLIVRLKFLETLERRKGIRV